jgi:1-aminocyclopropane-1-carboxylate deaminase/D-cysteine desulfhydrase-like pyridoxal-dependent ACC family enzyme
MVVGILLGVTVGATITITTIITTTITVLDGLVFRRWLMMHSSLMKVDTTTSHGGTATTAGMLVGATAVVAAVLGVDVTTTITTITTTIAVGLVLQTQLQTLLLTLPMVELSWFETLRFVFFCRHFGIFDPRETSNCHRLRLMKMMLAVVPPSF